MTSAVCVRRSIVMACVALIPVRTDAQPVAPPCPWPGPPQFLADRASPPDSVLFTVGGAPGKLCYSRPAARGRRVFGGLVEFGKRWRTGANEPTVLFLPVAASVAGLHVPAGRYILMTVPDAAGWTLLLSTSDAAAPMFDALTEVGRAAVPVDSTSVPVEQLTFRTERDTATLTLILEWERTRVRVPIRIP